MRKTILAATLAIGLLAGCTSPSEYTPRPEPEWIFRFVDGTELRRPCRDVWLSSPMFEDATLICQSRRNGMEWPATALAFYALASEVE